VATKFYSGSYVWNLLRVTILEPRILTWLLDFLEILCTPDLRKFGYVSITNNIRYTSQTQQIYYGVQGQVNDNMFRPY